MILFELQCGRSVVKLVEITPLLWRGFGFCVQEGVFALCSEKNTEPKSKKIDIGRGFFGALAESD